MAALRNSPENGVGRQLPARRANGHKTQDQDKTATQTKRQTRANVHVRVNPMLSVTVDTSSVKIARRLAHVRDVLAQLANDVQRTADLTADRELAVAAFYVTAATGQLWCATETLATGSEAPQW